MLRLFTRYLFVAAVSVTMPLGTAAESLGAPESIAGKVYRETYGLGSIYGERTIVFGPQERFHYLVSRQGQEGPTATGVAFSSFGAPPDGTYTYKRISPYSASLTLQFDDGTSSGMTLVFINATTGVRDDRTGWHNNFSLLEMGAAGNMSMRGTVTSERPLIVGFVLSEDRDVLIRAVGPSLRAFGITTGWPDPDFRLFRGNTPVTTRSGHNGDWDAPNGPFKASQAPELRKAFSYVGAFPLPEKSKDAADTARLSAGSYTVTCAAANNDDPGGEVLVEVYFLP